MKALDSANPDDREGAIDNLAQFDHPVAQELLLLTSTKIGEPDKLKQGAKQNYPEKGKNGGS